MLHNRVPSSLKAFLCRVELTLLGKLSQIKMRIVVGKNVDERGSFPSLLCCGIRGPTEDNASFIGDPLRGIFRKG